MLEITSSPAPFDVLVVDDEADMRDAMKQLLEDHGYSVAEAGNGGEALELLKSAPSLPKIVLLDLKMPILDGWEFCRLSDEDPELRDLPVAVVSGAAIGRPQDLPARHADAGYIAKPVDFDRLLGLIESYCGQREPAAPAPRPPAQRPRTEHDAREIRGAGHGVLVVEDDPDLRDALSSIVAGEGYTVQGARDGRDALRVLREGFRPSVILVDLLMPVMDGWELCEEISHHEDLARIPVILMSASGGPYEPPHPKSLVRLFRKPFTFVQLLDAIAKGCAGAPAAAPAPS